MPPCHSEYHPQLPITTVTAAAVLCHSCMGWQTQRSMYSQTGELELELTGLVVVEYGPFDTTELVAAETAAWLQATMQSAWASLG